MNDTSPAQSLALVEQLPHMEVVSKSEQCVRGMRNKVNRAFVLSINTALDDKRPAEYLTCSVGAAFQPCSAAELILI